MERKYVFFNTGRAFVAMCLGTVLMLLLAGGLAFAGGADRLVVAGTILACAAGVAWLCYRLDRE